ncbi:hypothetical protein BMB171_C0618 [Bacillus thuringiensis BMB171]|nr:hypothetical protein BMB171_C0618 [Bacillus thuringiensis BMB171]
MHYTFICRNKIKLIFFMNRKSIHIGSNRNCFARMFTY